MPRHRSTSSTTQDFLDSLEVGQSQLNDRQTNLQDGSASQQATDLEQDGLSDDVPIRKNLARVQSRSDKIVAITDLFVLLQGEKSLEDMLSDGLTDEDWKGLKRDLITSVIDPEVVEEALLDYGKLDAETQAKLAASAERDRKATIKKLQDMEAEEARRLLLAYKEGILKKKGDISSFDRPSTTKRTLRKIVRAVFD